MFDLYKKYFQSRGCGGGGMPIEEKGKIEEKEKGRQKSCKSSGLWNAHPQGSGITGFLVGIGSERAL